MRASIGRALAGALVIAAAVITTACSSVTTLESARKKDRECVDALGTDVTEKHARSWFVVQDGEVAAISPAADDAVRAAAAPRAASAPASSAATATRGALHQFVFRVPDRGDRLYRMAFLPDGGMVAGRGLLADLGFRVASAGVAGAGRTLVLDHHGSRRSIDLSQRPRIQLELTPLGGGAVTTLDLPLDPDFDGPLLLTADAGRTLDLDRAEIPGRAEVQVALGRPFNARRAFAAAKCRDLDAAGAVEVLVPSERAAPRK